MVTGSSRAGIAILPRERNSIDLWVVPSDSASTATKAVVRELREEMGVEVTELKYIGVLENTFTFDDKPWHEIVLVYEGRFADPHPYSVESIRCVDDDGEFVARWKPVADFQAGKYILYPEGLLDLLDRQAP